MLESHFIYKHIYIYIYTQFWTKILDIHVTLSGLRYQAVSNFAQLKVHRDNQRPANGHGFQLAARSRHPIIFICGELHVNYKLLEPN